MADEPKSELEQLEEATMPFLTLVSSLLVLAVFLVAGVALYRQLEKDAAQNQPSSPELGLKQMKEAQEIHLNSTGYDENTKSSFMPITYAMDRLVKQKAEKAK